MQGVFSKIKVLLVIFILLVGWKNTYAIDETFSARELRGNQLRKDSVSDVLDTSYFLFTPNLTTYQVRNLITFKIDEYFNKKMPDTFNVTLKFKVYFWRLVGEV
ncbi:MAG: hypothetical protein IPP79_05030 [Chitinophagaceae bacterium]|nr:hypothetical protein [Chitinophagaceae bacterium]